ncbi:NAD-dependent DNA ligase LigA [Mycoplasma phocoeninasale]|uniref:DNA ligase n=1 Tax=Mycoplasma phocoeninasale TaxID=2726117 RepID=A0A858U3L6_9MOLU|nr:NAD-dependent DNA ligase LigA [Mycoplasma phocoeninasale]QJG66639.1 NAD-dependent DNA ligase LigA [Mycoplasma phocoeninasale]
MEDKQKNEIRKQVFELREKIDKWDKEYYDLDNPEVPDSVYDLEFNKLKKMEEQYAHYFSYEEIKSSPTQKINSTPLSIFQKVYHESAMLSLNKAYSIDEIKKFIDNIAKITNEFSFFIEPKIDGISISIKYKDGKLFQALTRGDGKVGEDVTENVLQIKDIPKTINYFNDLEVRGEIYLSIEEFNNLNKDLESKGKTKLANPRNAAAGTLRQLNSEIVKERKLSAFLYYIVNPLDHNIETMKQSFEFLNSLGFKISKEAKHVNSVEEIEEYIKEFKNIKQLLNYETDGIVIKLNEIKYYNKLGSTSKFPHSAIAFKYEPDTAITVLKKIFITTGRTGLITYNALLEPVELSGSLVSYATLNNFQYIEDLNLNENDLVYVKKAGEIIPCVIGLASKKDKDNSTRFKKFLFCPYCNFPLEDSSSQLEQFCTNANCPEINRRKLIHFCSKDAMDITMLGEKNIELLLENHLLSTPADIYELKSHKDELVNLARLGNKSVLKILDAIEETKTKSLERLIFGLSIKLIGAKVAKLIASEVKEFSNFLSFDFLSLLKYNEIGDKVTNSIIEWIKIEDNAKLVNSLLAKGLNLKYINNAKNTKFQNFSFVITGVLSKPRSYFEELIIVNGGLVKNSISSKTTYLLAGDDAGSKLAKANNLGIKIINEEEFNELMQD